MVYVVVLSWNFREYTLNCLESVVRMRGCDFRVLLVDNASTDGTVPAVRERFPQVQVHVNPEDLGFAGGVNVGLRIALEQGATYVLLVSNDTVLEPDLLERLVEAAEAEPAVGILSPLIYYPGRERVWYAGAYRRRFWPGISWLGYGLRDRPRYHVRRQVDYVTGCVLLLRAAMLRQVGLLDTTFFMYYEDLDLCERARRAGWQLLLVPAAVVDHIGSVSYGEFSATKWFHLARYAPEFYRRYYRRPRLAVLLYMGWVFMRETLRGNTRVLSPLWRGFWGGWEEAFRRRRRREGPPPAGPAS